MGLLGPKYSYSPKVLVIIHFDPVLISQPTIRYGKIQKTISSPTPPQNGLLA